MRLRGCLWPWVSPLGSTPSTCSHNKTPCCALTRPAVTSQLLQNGNASHTVRAPGQWSTGTQSDAAVAADAAMRPELQSTPCTRATVARCAERCMAHHRCSSSQLRCLPAQHAEANSAHHSRCFKKAASPHSLAAICQPQRLRQLPTKL